MWMDDVREAAARRGKTIQEARSMAMTQKMDRGPDAERQKGKIKKKKITMIGNTFRHLVCAINTPPYTEDGSIHRPDRPWGPSSLLYKYPVSFPGVKRPGRGVNHPPHLTLRLRKE